MEIKKSLVRLGFFPLWFLPLLLCLTPVVVRPHWDILSAMTNRTLSSLAFAMKAAVIALPIALGIIDAPSIRAQSQPTSAPRFEVASVKPNTSTGPGGTRLDPAGINIARARLLDLIATAYKIPYSRISTTDSRTQALLNERYDIVAKAGREVGKDELLRMLQTLLADRLKLTLHHETKVQSVYKLLIAKNGPKLLESKPTHIPDQNCTFPQCMAFINTEMWVFAAALTGRMGGPVLDWTGLNGSYDFSLRLDILEGLTNDKPDIKPQANDWSSSSIFTDIEKQLGLRLESDRAPVEFLIIDHAERASEN